MLSRIAFITLSLCFLISCKTYTSKPSGKSGPTVVSIVSYDLSEDLSLISTKNDELVLLMFEVQADTLGKTLLQAAFTFDKSITKNTLVLENEPTTSDLLIVLIELDTEATPSDIGLIVRAHFKKLIEASSFHDLVIIESILGDDDLLGIQITDRNPGELRFSGTQRMDHYEYFVRF